LATLKRSGGWRKYLIVSLVVALILLGAGVAIVSYNAISSRARTPTGSTSSSGSSSSESGYPEDEALYYSGLGYPRLTYSVSSPYLPSKPNYTMEYQTTSVTFQVGSVGGDVIDLNQAVGIAAAEAGLDPTNYSLAQADFDPGIIVNSTLSLHPEWVLSFARVYDSYWLWGGVGSGAVSVQVDVDALNGTASSSTSLPKVLPLGQFKLNVNAGAALGTVRNSSLPGVPEELSANGSVIFVSPRIVLFGPSSVSAAFMNPIDPSFDGQYELCWVVDLSSPTPQNGYQGTFAVDAETGALISSWAEALPPTTQVGNVTASLDYLSARNLTLSKEAFQIDGGIIGSSGSLPVTVPDVVVVSQNSTASIGLNFSSTLPEDVTDTLSFANPLPGIESLSQDGMPPRVSLLLEPQSSAVPGGQTSSAQLLISAGKGAPSGTYLVEVDVKLYDQHGAPQGASEILFFLSIWDGAGHWPPPPIIK
jgi:hypothetical protein